MIFDDMVMRKRIGYANLNDGAIWWEKKHNIPRDERPFKDPDVAHQMEGEYHAFLGLDWSFGGWMEDRSCIRRGTYLEKDERWIHIGIDLNVDEYTEVHAIADGEIVYVGTDVPLVGGWGNHVIQLIEWKERQHALMYAHLGYVAVAIGDTMHSSRRTLIGEVGGKERNGFWRPHLHLQLFADIDNVTDWKKFSEEIDGYVSRDEIEKWARRCPDPTPLLFGSR